MGQIDRWTIERMHEDRENQTIHRVARAIHGQTLSYREAELILGELLIHLHPEDVHKLCHEMYYRIMPQIEGRFREGAIMPRTRHEEEYMNKLHTMQTAFPTYKFKMKKDGSMELLNIDKTTSELDELLEEEKERDVFIEKDEMKI